MSKADNPAITRMTDKYSGVTITSHWHDNGDVSLIPGGKQTLVELYERLPNWYKHCKKIGLTSDGWVAYENPHGDILFYGIYVTPTNVKVRAKNWYVERDKAPNRSLKDHPVGHGWYLSPDN